MARSKKYRAALEELKGKESFSLDEAISLLTKTSTTKFDSSCEVHMNLGIDPKQADQLIRTPLSLPHGTGKKVRVIAIVPDDKIKEATDAGAIEAGNEDIIEKISGGWLDFDVVVATPDVMKTIGKVAKTLGQKGLMPNPKSGTVTPDVGKVVGEIIKGKVEVRNDKLGNLHNIFGKVSFGEAKLKENLQTFIKKVQDLKPSSLKGAYVKSLTITTSMGPGIAVDVKEMIAQ